MNGKQLNWSYIPMVDCEGKGRKMKSLLHTGGGSVDLVTRS